MIVFLDEFIDDLLLDAGVFFFGVLNPIVEGGEAFIDRDLRVSEKDAVLGQTQIR